MNTQDEIEQQTEAGVSQISGQFAEERQRLLEDEKKLVCEKKRLDEEKRRLKEEEKRLDCEKKKLNKEKRRLRKAEKESHKEEKRRRNTDKEVQEFKEYLDEIKIQHPESVSAVVEHRADKLSMNLWPKWVRVIGYIMFGLSIVAGVVEMSLFHVFDLLPKKDPLILSFILSCSLDIFILYILSFLNSRFFNVLIMLPLQILARNQYKERLKKWCKQNPNDERGDYLKSYNNGAVKLIWINFFKPKWGSDDLCWMPWV